MRHGVRVGESWGSLPAALQARWSAERCDERVGLAGSAAVAEPPTVGTPRPAAAIGALSGAPVFLLLGDIKNDLSIQASSVSIINQAIKFRSVCPRKVKKTQVLLRRSCAFQ